MNGLIKLTIYLPAKQEKCEFTLKLYNDTVGTLTENIKSEDKSIEKAHIYATGKSSYIHVHNQEWLRNFHFV